MAAVLIALAVPAVVAGHCARSGQVAEDSGDLAAAERADRAALRWDRSHGDARFDLVRVLTRQQRYGEALRESDELLRWVNEPECWLLRARLRQNAGLDAVPELRAAVALFPYSAELRSELADAEAAAAQPSLAPGRQER